MSIDASTHSLFGVSKAAADLMVQEYGRYFDMPTVCFRGGCLTGPAHAGAQLHGFLSYLMKCAVTGEPLHGLRLRRQAGARQHPLLRRGQRHRGVPSTPRGPARSTTSAAGASRNCSMLEAIAACERISGDALDWTLLRRRAGRRPPLVDLGPLGSSGATTRTGRCATTSRRTLREIHDANAERWTAAAPMKVSVVIPAHNEAQVDRPDASARSPRRWTPRGATTS